MNARGVAGVSYARARLWLGITSVGGWVVIAALILSVGLPEAWWEAAQRGGLGAQAFVLAQALAIYVLLALPFDLIGGWWLPARYERRRESLGAYLVRWCRGVLVQSLVMLSAALALIAAGQFAGLLGATVTLFASSLLLLAVQPALASWVARVRKTPVGKRIYWESSDRGFAGGWVGMPGHEREVQPAHWRSLLSDDELHAQQVRRDGIVATGSRRRGIWLAIAFNLLGFVLCAQLPGAGVTSAAALLTTALGFTVWSFLGLLILPTPSRAGVYEADHHALESGIAPELLISSTRKLDRLQEDETERPAGVEAVFHPVPSVENRILRLRGNLRAWGAHHATRNALYLSWACLGFLARAVHCNAGRPDVWVILPAD